MGQMFQDLEQDRFVFSGAKMRGFGVYFVELANVFSLIKIGYTRNLTARLKDNTFCPFGLKPVLFVRADNEAECRALEAEFHSIFSADRYRREWFWASDALTIFINRFTDYKPAGKILSVHERDLVSRLLDGEYGGPVYITADKPGGLFRASDRDLVNLL